MFGYSAPVKPIINLEETIGKTVGRRMPPRDAFAYAMGLQKTLVALNAKLPTGGVPRGVYRFHTHEEADAWMLKMLTRPRK